MQVLCLAPKQGKNEQVSNKVRRRSFLVFFDGGLAECLTNFVRGSTQVLCQRIFTMQELKEVLSMFINEESQRIIALDQVSGQDVPVNNLTLTV